MTAVLDSVNRARKMLGLLPLTADGSNYREWQHPRDKHGQWIEKGGLVRIADKIAGIVQDMLPNGNIRVKVTDSPDPKQINTDVDVPNTDIEVIETKASLAPSAPQTPKAPNVATPTLDAPEIDLDADATPVQKFNPADRKMVPATPEQRAKYKPPPTWTDLMYNSSYTGDPNLPDEMHDGLLMTGRDKQGNTQYLYDKRAEVIRAGKKFGPEGSVTKTLENLDPISAGIRRDMMTNDSAAALALQLTMGMRVGGQTSKAKKIDAEAIGASSMRAENVKVFPDGVVFTFRGKKGVPNIIRTSDPMVMDLIAEKLKTKSGQDRLFNTTAARVGKYFKDLQDELGIEGLHPHNLRHAFATTMARSIIDSMSPPRTEAEFKTMKMQVAQKVSSLLGNNASEAIKSYIDPKVWDRWLDCLDKVYKI